MLNNPKKPYRFSKKRKLEEKLKKVLISSGVVGLVGGVGLLFYTMNKAHLDDTFARTGFAISYGYRIENSKYISDLKDPFDAYMDSIVGNRLNVNNFNKSLNSKEQDNLSNGELSKYFDSEKQEFTHFLRNIDKNNDRLISSSEIDSFVDRVDNYYDSHYPLK